MGIGGGWGGIEKKRITFMLPYLPGKGGHDNYACSGEGGCGDAYRCVQGRGGGQCAYVLWIVPSRNGVRVWSWYSVI